MHRKANKFEFRLISIVASIGLLAASLVYFYPAGQAQAVTMPEEGLQFISDSNVLENAEIGDSFIYEDIGVNDVSSNAVRAKLSVISLDNSRADLISSFEVIRSDSELFLYQFYFGISEYEEAEGNYDPEDPSEYLVVSQATVRYTIDDGISWTELPAFDGYGRYELDTNPEDWGQVTFRSPVTESLVRVEAKTIYSICTEAPGVEPDTTEVTCSPDSYWPLGGSDFEDLNFVDFEEVPLEALRFGDRFSDSASTNKRIRVSMAKMNYEEVDDAELRVDFKLEFLDGNGDPVTLESLAVNANDIDSFQWVEFQNITSYLLTQGTIINNITRVNDDPTHLKFQANEQCADAVLDDPLDDDSCTVLSDGEARVQVNFENVSEIYFSSGIPVGASESASQNFDFSYGPDWIGASGALIPVELTGGELPSLSSPREPRSPAQATPTTLKSTKVVGGFGHFSKTLTPRMKKRITTWMAKHPELKSMTCTGFTSLPKRPNDARLARNRGVEACDFAKSLRTDLKVTVSNGVQDPKPGSSIRRVRLVLTP